MKNTICAIALGLSLTGTSIAATPATAPTAPLPKGHPDISQMRQAVGQPATPPLPAGHPDLSPLMKQAAQNGLPAGHPQMPPADAAPSTQQVAMTTLTIQAIQGTAGGPAIGADPVVLELTREGLVISKLEAKLDATGKVTFRDLPSGLNVEPVVRILHAGVEYAATAPPLSVEHSSQPLMLNVFESTQDQPDWRIKIRHVIVQPRADGVQIMEMMNIENPSDRAWIGKPTADGKHTTIELPLPKGAKDVKLLAGFDDSATVQNDRIVSSMALVPEITRYQLTYVVPAVDGKVSLAVSSPAAVDRTMVFVPDDGSTVVTTNIEALGAKANDRGGSTRYFKAQGTKAGDTIGLTLTNLPQNARGDAGDDAPADLMPAIATAGMAPQVPGLGNTPQMVAVVGTVLILFVGVAFLFKPATAKK